METNSKRKVALTVGLVLVVVCLAAQICILAFRTGGTAMPTFIATIAVYMASFLFAGIYIATGFKKSFALFFKLFIYAFMLALLLHIVIFAHMGLHLSVVIHVVSFGFLNVLAFAKDLGKKKSMFFAYAILALMIGMLAYGIIDAVIVFEDPANVIVKTILDSVGKLTASSILVSTVRMKYLDKQSRNAK